MEFADPRAAGFSAAEFRDGIQFAMKMGAANRAENKVVFLWDEDKTYPIQDPDAKPYHWDDTPATDVTHEPVTIDEVGVKLTEPRLGSVAGTPVGQFDEVRAILTLLDVDFERIDGSTNPPNHVRVGGDDYLIRFISSSALFDVDIFKLHCVAMDVN